MTRTYPLNCWYVAATSDEVTTTPLARRLLDESTVLFRQSSGTVVALDDRCAHRGFPLSHGSVVEDEIVCGYHGFTYSSAGVCTRVPSQQAVPARTRVRSYPIVEDPPFIWIWPGTPQSANLRRPPTTVLGSDGWAGSGTTFAVAANYTLVHEHYLDLTHALVMHREMVPPGIETLPPLGHITVSEMSVSYRRTLPEAQLAPWEAQATKLPPGQTCTRTEHGTFVSPALNVGGYEITSAAGDTFRHLRIHAITPESDATTRIWLRVARDYALDDEDVTNGLLGLFATLADRDMKVLELVQANQRGSARQVNVVADRAATQARKVINALVADEAGRPASRSR